MIGRGKTNLEQCPVCGRNDAFVNVGRDHWGFCPDHKLKWYLGSNLFSGWKDESPVQHALNEVFLGDCLNVTGGKA